jgi:hypothetical protein
VRVELVEPGPELGLLARPLVAVVAVPNLLMVVEFK